MTDVAARMGTPMRLEGIAVAPLSFGPCGGQIIIGIKGIDDADPQSGKVYTV